MYMHMHIMHMHAQVRLLVEGGAPLGNADDEGLTPLHLAAYSGKLEERPI